MLCKICPSSAKRFMKRRVGRPRRADRFQARKAVLREKKSL